MAALAHAQSTGQGENGYAVRPSYTQMWKPRQVKTILKEVLSKHLEGKVYSQDETSKWTKDIATQVKERLKGLSLPRYKHMVQVVIGEMKGAGVRMGCRCLWDEQTDKVAQEIFMNDSLFCVAVAFGVYLY